MSGQHCENYDVNTREMLTAVARHLSITWWFVFHRFNPFALLYNKSLNNWSLGEQWILFPSNLNVSLDFVSGNIEILGKQNSLFPSGPVIKCLIFTCQTLLKYKYPDSVSDFVFNDVACTVINESSRTALELACVTDSLNRRYRDCVTRPAATQATLEWAKRSWKPHFFTTNSSRNIRKFIFVWKVNEVTFSAKPTLCKECNQKRSNISLSRYMW